MPDFTFVKKEIVAEDTEQEDVDIEESLLKGNPY